MKQVSDRSTVAYDDENHLIYTRGRRVYVSPRTTIRVPIAGWRYRLGIGRFGRRLVRGGIRHAVILPPTTTIVVVAGKQFFRLDPCSTSNSTPIAYTVTSGAGTVGSNPLCAPAVVPVSATGAEAAAATATPSSTPTAAIYYGEYRPNPERSPVRVWRSTDGALSFSPAWTFTSVRHVHGVFTDPFASGTLWVTTGDDDTESAIWRTTDSFATLEPVVRGGQQARAVDLVFTAEGVYFGSDTPREQNYLYRLDRRTGAVERQQPVAGSVFWGRSTPDGWRLFSTVVEKSSVNTSRDAELWAAPPDHDEWRCIYRAQKDPFHDKYFDHGQLRFPAGPGQPGAVWITPYAVAGDQRSRYIELALSWGNAPSGAVQ